MARTLHHGSPQFVDPLKSYVLEENEIIVNELELRRRLSDFLTESYLDFTIDKITVPLQP